MKILFIFGTRPEIIKIFPVYKKLVSAGFNCLLCSTDQNKEMQKHFSELFEIAPHFDLDIMRHNQSLTYVSFESLNRLEGILIDEKPDMIMVQGDTTTSFVGALSAFYRIIKIAHIEAGFRTFEKYLPYPEEMNRALISRLADYNFVPTRQLKII